MYCDKYYRKIMEIVMQPSDLGFITGLFKQITYRTQKVVWSNGEALKLVVEYLGSSSRLCELR